MFSLFILFLNPRSLFPSLNISLCLWWIPFCGATHSFAFAKGLSEGLLLSHRREILSDIIKSKCLVVFFSKGGTGTSVNWLYARWRVCKIRTFAWILQSDLSSFLLLGLFAISMMAFYSSFLTSVDGLFFLTVSSATSKYELWLLEQMGEKRNNFHPITC